ncbi:MAG: hypothetical protein ACODAD_12205 [Planctomycetota bacterium]
MPNTTKTINSQQYNLKRVRVIPHPSPRGFQKVPDGRLFMLLVDGIAQIAPKTYEITMVTEWPQAVKSGYMPGGDYLKGRIYFGSESRLYSWAVPE